jgi:hypothetical protein
MSDEQDQTQSPGGKLPEEKLAHSSKINFLATRVKEGEVQTIAHLEFTLKSCTKV